MVHFELSSRARRSRGVVIQLDCFVSAAKPRLLAMTNWETTGVLMCFPEVKNGKIGRFTLGHALKLRPVRPIEEEDRRVLKPSRRT